MAGTMCAVIGTSVVLHLPGRVPAPIDGVVNRQSVYGDRSHVNVPIVTFLINQYLADNSASVLAQYFTITGDSRSATWDVHHASREGPPPYSMAR